MARADEETANAAQGGRDFLGHELAKIGIARCAWLGKVFEWQDGDRRTVRDLREGLRNRTLKGCGLGESRAKPMRRL